MNAKKNLGRNFGNVYYKKAWKNGRFRQHVGMIWKLPVPTTQTLPLKVGVPQGFTLGPIPITDCTQNYLLSFPKLCKIMGYVDDTKIFLVLPPSELSDMQSSP